MRVGVVRFPGSNCDEDMLRALSERLHLEARFVWHEDTSLQGLGSVVLPGGFSYGDYLRSGAIASRSPIMDEVERFAREGRLVLGVCNGFQVLCERRILPGALQRNHGQRFVCRQVVLRTDSHKGPWLAGIDRLLRVPVAHGEGAYVCDERTLRELEEGGRIAFRYVSEAGEPSSEANPNGSIANIAGIINEGGNVLGLMPHPERATSTALRSVDGLQILRALQLVAV